MDTRRVAVCALTYLRPTGLERLLRGIEQLDLPDSTDVQVVIVDNDPAGSARPVVEQDRSRFGMSYVHEARRGISHARNAAVSTALELGADLICFIDDDEWPDPAWLVEFVTTRDQTAADIVTGPVFPVFDEPPPQWIVDGGFFERRRHDHHERIRYATTSTVMMSSDCVAGLRQPFDPAFGLSGGEDTHLFAQLRERGFVSVWCDRAHVYESIPPSRVDPRWLLRREYRRGQTLSLSLRRRNPTALRYVRRVGNATLELGQGALTTLIGLPRGRARWFAGIQQIVFGAGMFTGLLGRRYQEYTSTHGR